MHIDFFTWYDSFILLFLKCFCDAIKCHVSLVNRCTLVTANNPIIGTIIGLVVDVGQLLPRLGTTTHFLAFFQGINFYLSKIFILWVGQACETVNLILMWPNHRKGAIPAVPVSFTP